jgi:hypothetical protein
MVWPTHHPTIPRRLIDDDLVSGASNPAPWYGNVRVVTDGTLQNVPQAEAFYELAITPDGNICSSSQTP